MAPGAARDTTVSDGIAPCAWILLAYENTDDPSLAARANLRVWGLSASERLTRELSRVGVKHVTLLEASEAPAAGPEGGAVFRGDYFYDSRLVAALVQRAQTLLLAPADDDGEPAQPVAARSTGDRIAEVVALLRGGEPPGPEARLSDMSPLAATELAPSYDHALRKREAPFLLRADPQRQREIENRIFDAAYKGLTDLVTKWLWPRPARAVVRQLAARGIRPDSVTAWSYALTGFTIGCFAAGWFAVGLASAWLMTFLDTVDGKLARVTLTSSRLGGALDHGLDLVHPPLWWIAWAHGLSSGAAGLAGAAGLEIATWIVVAGYLLGRAWEGVFMLIFGMEMFSWRPFDGAFRQVIARRNPNLLLLTAGTALGRPDLGFFAVAFWTLASNAVQVARLSQALAQRANGRPVRAWHETADPARA